MYKLKTAFDSIHAEESLKNTTMAFLQERIKAHGKAGNRFSAWNIAAVLACVLVLISGVYTTWLYFAPNAYVDVDINPSIELTVNCFDRIIGTHAFNAEGEEVLEELSLLHKEYGEALLLLLGSIDQKGYIMGDGFVSVTLQTNSREEDRLAGIQAGVTDFLHDHHDMTELEVFGVSAEIRDYAYEQDISPAKYLAIRELMEADPEASMETCKNHTISEIRQMTREHSAHHAAGKENGDDAAQTTAGNHGNASGGNGHHGAGHGGH